MDMVHPGEISVRERAGSKQYSIGSGHVGDTIPDVARDFVDGARLAALAVVDEHGETRADVLAGAAGFLRAPDPRTLEIAAVPPLTAPLFASGAECAVGLIVLEPWTRRRMRVNGRAVRDGRGLLLQADQVYANCPKYIQTRTVVETDQTTASYRSWEPETSRPSSGRLGDVTHRELIGDADTFFLATYAQGHGADMSHRGGNPGFVTVVDDAHLSWPEYAGNSMYMSLGNLLLEPRCALVFPDWSTGRTLHLRGRAFVDWDARRAAGVPKAQRIVDFEVEEVVEIADGMPLRWRFGEYHRFNPPTGKPRAAGDSTPVASAQ
jgi:predicted pyridoxine 5'-phosphate oxidase superfamily flavin-nucleotide-binding protein